MNLSPSLSDERTQTRPFGGRPVDGRAETNAENAESEFVRTLNFIRRSMAMGRAVNADESVADDFRGREKE